MCAAHATVRGLLHDVTEQAGTVVIDMEAGLEHLSRGTPRYVDTLLLVAEPYFKSMETAARSKTMAKELGIPRIRPCPIKSEDHGTQRRCTAFSPMWVFHSRYSFQPTR